MDTRLGQERITTNTVDAIERESPTAGLQGIENLLSVYAQRDREDWDRQQVANVRAKSYTLADEFQKRIQAGEVSNPDGTPMDENQLVNAYRARIQEEIGRLHSTVRKRASAEVSMSSAIQEADLRGQLRNYYGQRKLAELQSTTDVHDQAATNAPDDAVAGIILDQAIGDIDQTIELNPIQKVKAIGDLRKSVWGKRLETKLKTPDVDLGALTGWINGLSIDAATRDEFLQALETRGKEIKRGETDAFLNAQTDAYIATPAARTEILKQTTDYLETRRNLYRPEEFEKVKQSWLKETTWNSFLYDLQFRGYDKIDPNQYGLDPERQALAADAIERSKISAIQQAAFFENKRQIEQNRQWQQEFGKQQIALIEAMRDPNFDMNAIDRLQTSVKAAQLDGFGYGEELFRNLERMKNEFIEKREKIGIIEPRINAGIATPDEADLYWNTYIQEKEKETTVSGGNVQPINKISALDEFVKTKKVIPRFAIKEMESSIIMADPTRIRLYADKYMQFKRDTKSAATQEIPIAARKVFEAVGELQRTDQEIGRLIELANDPDEQEKRKQKFQKLTADKSTTTMQLKKAIQGGIGQIIQTYNIGSEMMKGNEFTNPIYDYRAEQMEEEILRHAEENIQLDPSEDITEGLKDGIIETLKQWSPWTNGITTYWMKHSPLQYINDSTFLQEKLREGLKEFGIKTEKQMTHNAWSPFGVWEEEKVVDKNGKGVEITLHIPDKEISSKQTIPYYYILINGEYLKKGDTYYKFGGDELQNQYDQYKTMAKQASEELKKQDEEQRHIYDMNNPNKGRLPAGMNSAEYAARLFMTRLANPAIDSTSSVMARYMSKLIGFPFEETYAGKRELKKEDFERFKKETDEWVESQINIGK